MITRNKKGDLQQQKAQTHQSPGHSRQLSLGLEPTAQRRPHPAQRRQIGGAPALGQPGLGSSLQLGQPGRDEKSRQQPRSHRQCPIPDPTDRSAHRRRQPSGHLTYKCGTSIKQAQRRLLQKRSQALRGLLRQTHQIVLRLQDPLLRRHLQIRKRRRQPAHFLEYHRPCKGS